MTQMRLVICEAQALLLSVELEPREVVVAAGKIAAVGLDMPNTRSPITTQFGFNDKLAIAFPLSTVWQLYGKSVSLSQISPLGRSR